MNTYDRLFGSGPGGIGVSLALFAMAWRLEAHLGWPAIIDSDVLRWTVFAARLMAAVGLAAWSFKSLPMASRGVLLVTSGPYRYELLLKGSVPIIPDRIVRLRLETDPEDV